MKLNKNDYLSILDFYKIDYSKDKSFSNIKNLAEDIIATKLCSCIKKVDPKDESKSIAICRTNIVHKKGFKINRFTCKKKPKLFFSKKTKNKLHKK